MRKMEKTYDVVALGELLIDLTQNGTSAQGNLLFEANPGGAPCNVLAMLQKLGHSTAFIGKVGEDNFGHVLAQALQEAGIAADGLHFDKAIPTTLSLVHKLPNGDRDFSFYRSPGADMMLRPDEIPEDLVKGCRIFHFGTLSMTDDPVRSATHRAIEMAERAGAMLSFDPNLRPPLWRSLDDAHRAAEYGMQHCQILKISDDEIEWFTGCSDLDAGIEQLRGEYQIPLVLASFGPQGSRAYYRDIRVEMPAYRNPEPVDTTGAGDTFCGCCLDFVLQHGLDDLREEDLRQMLRFANAAASCITKRKGALRVMPTRAEIDQVLNA